MKRNGKYIKQRRLPKDFLIFTEKANMESSGYFKFISSKVLISAVPKDHFLMKANI